MFLLIIVINHIVISLLNVQINQITQTDWLNKQSGKFFFLKSGRSLIFSSGNGGANWAPFLQPFQCLAEDVEVRPLVYT